MEMIFIANETTIDVILNGVQNRLNIRGGRWIRFITAGVYKSAQKQEFRVRCWSAALLT